VDVVLLQDRKIVLVVDDDLGVLKGLQRLLRVHGYDPILFSSAEAFKNHTDFEKTVCVILDINLNDGSGIELRRRLKAAGITVPVIYMSGNDDPAARRAALGSGCIAFLTKPFSLRELMVPLNRAARHMNSGNAL
jgi:FixJ family two-component response regulator